MNLRSALLHVARQQPNLRAHLVPLLREAREVDKDTLIQEIRKAQRLVSPLLEQAKRWARAKDPAMAQLRFALSQASAGLTKAEGLLLDFRNY